MAQRCSHFRNTVYRASFSRSLHCSPAKSETGTRRRFITLPSSSVVTAATIPAVHQLSWQPQRKMAWKALGASAAELTLEFTLPTGQSFRWRRTGDAEFTGVVDNRVVKVQQTKDDVQYQVIAYGQGAVSSEDGAVLRNYFNLQACLEDLCQDWASKDKRFKAIHTYFPGARVLRQDPVECLFEFICSSNNHISRIHGMVERLCRDYGTPMLHDRSESSAAATAPQAPTEEATDASAAHMAAASTAAPEEEQKAVPDLAFYSFPTLEQLSAASEAALRAEGFGYRAKFITGTVKALLAKPGGGKQWLYSLRDVPYREASEALCELPGIGPKVAACICLFALDKHEAIPVDTHVWQLAVRYYTPHLKGKTMNKKIMTAVEDAFNERFGPWAGWAHNTLFISELASQRERLPEHLRPGSRAKPDKAPSQKQDVETKAEKSENISSDVQKEAKGVGQRRAATGRTARVRQNSKAQDLYAPSNAEALIRSPEIKVDEDAALAKRGLDSDSNPHDVIDGRQARVKRAKTGGQQHNDAARIDETMSKPPVETDDGQVIDAQQMPQPDLTVNAELAQNSIGTHHKRAANEKQAAISSQSDRRCSSRRTNASKHGVKAAAEDALDQSLQDAVENGRKALKS